MEKNTGIAIFLSTLFLVGWWAFFQAPQNRKAASHPTEQAAAVATTVAATAPATAATLAADTTAPEQEYVVETDQYRAVFTNRGAAVKHWYLKETNGTLTDLVFPGSSPVLTTFPGSSFTLSRPSPRALVFTHRSPLGWRVTKTYDLSEDFLHSLTITTALTKNGAALPVIELPFGPGLGTDTKELKDNITTTRAIAFPQEKPRKLEKLKPGEYPAVGYQWAAIDNRYFLAAFMPENAAQFPTLSVFKDTKKGPSGLVLSTAKNESATTVTYKLNFYLGPKGMDHLKSLHLNLEETIDFGFFGFLGKAALAVLFYLKKMTGNYGWAIIFLTIMLQIIVLPLTIKSFKATAAMKHLQPHIKALQDKYKDNPQRLNMEMLNLYKTQKVNPLGGCLPMLLQLPIFWALFTTLRNAYELRGAPWILWIRDLSAPDALMYIGGIPLNVLPLIMGIGMFFQQKLMAISTDPTQKTMMYLMPIIFTFMFWGFPSGLVIYWLTNSILTIIEQYFILHRPQTKGA
jgi:YidC/Oxa1 family membrane protein insertase